MDFDLSPVLLPAVAPGPLGCMDTSAYPFVRLTGPGAPGYGFAWAAALRRVLARGSPFVFIDHALGGLETPSDRQLRRSCFSAHAERLVSLCCGVILIQRDVALRVKAREEVRGVVGELPLRIVVVSKEAVAEQLARVLLTNQTGATGMRQG